MAKLGGFGKLFCEIDHFTQKKTNAILEYGINSIQNFNPL